jgi:hypothetical protein
MELEEMKALWGEMSVEIEKQKRLTDSLVIRMIRVDFRNKISKIWIPEIIGSLGCLAWALFILIDFQRLNTWYLLVCGIVSALILLLLPVLSVGAIWKMRSVNISANNYKQLLSEYSKGKLQFLFVQKLNFYLGAILMVTIFPVAGQLLAGKNFFLEIRLWYWFAIAFPFFYYFSRWVFRCYSRTAAAAGNILKELEG